MNERCEYCKHIHVYPNFCNTWHDYAKGMPKIQCVCPGPEPQYKRYARLANSYGAA